MLLSQPFFKVAPTEPFFKFLPTKFTACDIPKMNSQKKARIGFNSSSSNSLPSCQSIRKSLPLATAAALLLLANPAKAGFLSGFSGIESIPGPQLPQMDFLARFNEENQKKYAEADARFKSSPILKELLERSKLNKEKNRQETLDKYCIRGAEWGVGDCSAEAMKPEERENFIAALKARTGMK